MEDQKLHTFIYFEDLKNTPIVNGSVFSVEVTPIFNRQRSVRTAKLRLIEKEGHGDVWEHIFVNDQKTPLPVQAEVLLMEINCLPTWFWNQANGSYHGQFALYSNHKCDDVFTAETKGFPVLQ